MTDTKHSTSKNEPIVKDFTHLSNAEIKQTLKDFHDQAARQCGQHYEVFVHRFSESVKSWMSSMSKKHPFEFEYKKAFILEKARELDFVEDDTEEDYEELMAELRRDQE